MKTIDFSIKTSNMYHTLHEENVQLVENKKTGNATITGWTNQEINVGDRLDINRTIHEVTEVIERRDHKGIFENPEDKLNTFFKVKTKF